ncbi:MAG: hypothetical protein ABIP94_00575, partial [Planctomycetota bacterium]
MRWVTVLLVVGMVAGLIGAGIVWSGDETAPPSPRERTPEELARSDNTSVGPSQPWSTEPGAATGAEGGPVAGDESAERSQATPEVDVRRAPRVRVVRGQPAAPVADATLYFLNEATAEQRLRGLANPPERFDWPAAWGQHVVTDAEGNAQLPPTRVPWLAAAVLGDEFAFGTVPPGNRTVILVLRADETVTVLAVGADERPGSNLPVGLLQNQGTQTSVVWQGTTRPDGRAFVRHFQLVREDPRAQKGAEEPPAERFAAVLRAPCATPVVAEFIGRPAATEPVRLVVPAMGCIEVQLTDHRGTPLLSPAVLAVAIDGAKNPTEPFSFAQNLLQQREQKPVGGDPVRLIPIGVGTSLRLVARFEGDRRP